MPTLPLIVHGEMAALAPLALVGSACWNLGSSTRRATEMSQHRKLLEAAVAQCAADENACRVLITAFLEAGKPFATGRARLYLRRAGIDRADPMAVSEITGWFGAKIGVDPHPGHGLVKRLLDHPNIEGFVSLALSRKVKSKATKLAARRAREREQFDDEQDRTKDDYNLLDAVADREVFVRTPQLRRLVEIITKCCRNPRHRLIVYACGEAEQNEHALPINPEDFDLAESAELDRVDRARYESLFFLPEGDHTQVLAAIFGLGVENVRKIKSRVWEAVYSEFIRLGLERKPRISKAMLVSMLRRKKRSLPVYLGGRGYLRKVNPRFHAQWLLIETFLRGGKVRWDVIGVDPRTREGKAELEGLDEQGRSGFGALALGLSMVEGGEDA